MVGATGDVRFRREAASGRGVYRRQHVSDERRDHGDAAPRCGARARLHTRHVVHASNRVAESRGACRGRASGRGGASEWHALHQLLHAGRDVDIGPRCRFQGCNACIGSHTCSALLFGQSRWPSSARQFRRAAGGNYLAAMSPPQTPPRFIRYVLSRSAGRLSALRTIGPKPRMNRISIFPGPCIVSPPRTVEVSPRPLFR